METVEADEPEGNLSVYEPNPSAKSFMREGTIVFHRVFGLPRGGYGHFDTSPS